MDGKGRYSDNIFIERLWRTVKYEEVYLKAYSGGREAKAGLDAYFSFYNNRTSCVSGVYGINLPSGHILVTSSMTLSSPRGCLALAGLPLGLGLE